MKWLRDNAGVLTLLGSLLAGGLYLFVEYGPLQKKNEAEAIETILRSSIIELAKCVDNPQYVGESDRADRDPTCETRVYRFLEKGNNQ